MNRLGELANAAIIPHPDRIHVIFRVEKRPWANMPIHLLRETRFVESLEIVNFLYYTASNTTIVDETTTASSNKVRECQDVVVDDVAPED